MLTPCQGHDFFLCLSLAFESVRRRFGRLNAQKAKEIPRKTQKRYSKMIIAIDFDGVLCENDFPNIGKPNYDMISLVRQLMDAGHEVVLWTTRNGEELKKAVEWCTDYGLHFCSINEPAPSNEAEYKDKYPTQSRKIYADVYVDDHSIGYNHCDAKLLIKGGLKTWKKES